MRRLRITSGGESESAAGGRRRGLASVELVLALPFLLLVLAVIIDLGIVVKWKVRALAVSRQAVWRQRPGRNGASDPPPANWDSLGTSLSVGLTSSPLTDAFTQGGADKVVRGPLRPFQVNGDLFDMSGQVGQGNAKVNRIFPLLPPQVARVNLDVDHLLIDGQWRFWEMGYSRWDARRTMRLYSFEDPSLGPLQKKYRDAANDLAGASLRGDLYPLNGQYLFPDGSRRSFPQLPVLCENVFDIDDDVRDLIRRIERLPGQLEQAMTPRVTGTN